MTNREMAQQKVNALIECNRTTSAGTIADVLSYMFHEDLLRSDLYYELALEMKAIAINEINGKAA